MKLPSTLYIIAYLLVTTALASTNSNDLPPEYEMTVRGASSKDELGEILYRSVKENDFASLENLIPDEHHLDLLRSASPTVDKYLFEDLEETALTLQTKANFNRVIEKGIDKGLQWEHLQLVEGGEKKSAGFQQVNILFIYVQDNHENVLTISFDAIMIGERWFLFQGIRTEEPAAQIGYLKQ